MSNQIEIKGSTIRLFTGDLKDYISITDIVKYKKSNRSDDLIRNWIRNRNTIEFIGVWEQS